MSASAAAPRGVASGEFASSTETNVAVKTKTPHPGTPGSVKRIEVQGFSVEIIRKRVKNINLGIYDQGRAIRVSAPRWVSEAEIRAFIVSKAGWLRRHLEELNRREDPPPLEFVSGEIHWLAGRPYVLKVLEDSAINRVTVRENAIELCVKSGSGPEQRARILDEWRRYLLEERAKPMLKKWEETLGVQAEGFSIRNMSSRWGTCNTRTRRILLNLELAKYSDACLEYIVVHELAHLLASNHDVRFRGIMYRQLPDWPQRKRALEKHDYAWPGAEGIPETEGSKVPCDRADTGRG